MQAGEYEAAGYKVVIGESKKKKKKEEERRGKKKRSFFGQTLDLTVHFIHKRLCKAFKLLYQVRWPYSL